MKKKFTRNRRTWKRELVITSRQDETLDTRRAKLLTDHRFDVLLRFWCEMSRDGAGATLHYNVQGLVSLKSFVRRQILDEVGFVRILASVQDVLDTCAANRIPTEMVLFDPAYVFVDDQAQPRFVIVPLENMPYAVDNSPLTMLRVLSESRHLAFTSPAPEMLSKRLESFVLNQNNVFSGNAFRVFLREQCGVGRSRRHVPQDSQFVNSGVQSREHGETKLRMWSPLDKQGQVPLGYVLQRVNNGETFPLPDSQQVGVGRGSRNSVQIMGNPKLSRNHVLLRCASGMVRIIDLGSANGTWVRGERLMPNMCVNVAVGERFALANEEFVVTRG